jgi:hypothetical protein
MQRYKVIVLATGVPVPGAMLEDLTEYVRRGGTLVLNAKQLDAGEREQEALTGLHLTGGRATATGATWMSDNSTLAERTYDYSVAEPITASVIARTASGDPVVTKQAHGLGAVYVTTPDYLQDGSASGILAVGAKLLHTLVHQFAVATVRGPQLQYLVNTDRGRTIVTLVNTDLSGAAWNGTVSFPLPCGSCQVREWTTDRRMTVKIQGGQAVVKASVPAYDVRVYAIERAGGRQG